MENIRIKKSSVTRARSTGAHEPSLENQFSEIGSLRKPHLETYPFLKDDFHKRITSEYNIFRSDRLAEMALLKPD